MQALGLLNEKGQFKRSPEYIWKRVAGQWRLRIRVSIHENGKLKEKELHRAVLGTPRHYYIRFRSNDTLDFTPENAFYAVAPTGPEVATPPVTEAHDAGRDNLEEDLNVSQVYYYQVRPPIPHPTRQNVSLAWVHGHGYVASVDNDTIVNLEEAGLPLQWFTIGDGGLCLNDPVGGGKPYVKRLVMQARTHQDVRTGPGGKLDVTRENLWIVPTRDPKRQLKAVVEAVEAAPSVT